jgi:hypothetical protein
VDSSIALFRTSGFGEKSLNHYSNDRKKESQNKSLSFVPSLPVRNPAADTAGDGTE